ncbi:unnamed protein product [Penicillium roqueforti FM164]|uniref:Genomic scaffold, ProqFM164S03 n=1 Tax=Penicillium roqueforti (strain FM164) TaxID=1365484 RepID=W6QFN5_PENRF|nr:unnamed protein product [Penicillium roqueforti FM164]
MAKFKSRVSNTESCVDRAAALNFRIRQFAEPIVEMSLSFWRKWPTLYGEMVVHGPPPYKNCPPQQFLATCTAHCIFTPQMWSVGMCRRGRGPR